MVIGGLNSDWPKQHSENFLQAKILALKPKAFRLQCFLWLAIYSVKNKPIMSYYLRTLLKILEIALNLTRPHCQQKKKMQHINIYIL